jgi:predicted deacylase
VTSARQEPAKIQPTTHVAGSGVPIPVLSVVAKVAGPAVVVSANLHGDECTGIGVVHALARLLPTRLLRGSVYLYPSLNPQGLIEGTRRLPDDATDPNRAFPGNARGTPAERHAARVWADVISRRPELVLDLHTDTGGAIPYAILDRVVRGPPGLTEACLRFAEASGLTVLREYPKDRYLRFDLDRSLPGALVNGPGVPAVTLEVGPRRRIDRGAVEDALQAVLGVLTALGLCVAPAPQHATFQGGGPWRRESGPRTTRTGLLVPLVVGGERFEAGTLLAEVRALDGEVRERLVARSPGFVIALPEVAHVAIGTSCATVAIPDEG